MLPLLMKMHCHIFKPIFLWVLLLRNSQQVKYKYLLKDIFPIFRDSISPFEAPCILELFQTLPPKI